ncbi:MAG TPA: hypothetical protein VMR86_04970 [Myxococcota bacterium]|nr:hypothetical protein [Myxococcota bacterium]
MATGCGNLTIRSWVKIIGDQSSGQVTTDALAGAVFNITELQGGFLGRIVLDTSTLPGPVNGTVNVDDIRIAGLGEGVLGYVCIWQSPANPSSGTINLDILNSKGSTTIGLNILATARIADLLAVPPSPISQQATFPLNGVGISQLLNAAVTGNSDGLFATSASFVGDTTILDAPATFSLSIAVTNESTAPVFDPALTLDPIGGGCAQHFAEEGNDLFYGVNSKGSYLLAGGVDHPQPPTIIKLADLGAAPGSTLRIDRVGTYDDKTELRDGNATKVGAVFSSTNEVKKDNQRNRIPGAIEAGTNVTTGSYLKCLIFPICTSVPTDIPQDFAVTSGATLTVPAGAQYLIVAPIPDSLTWGDNSGFGLGVDLTVNP